MKCLAHVDKLLEYVRPGPMDGTITMSKNNVRIDTNTLHDIVDCYNITRTLQHLEPDTSDRYAMLTEGGGPQYVSTGRTVVSPEGPSRPGFVCAKYDDPSCLASYANDIWTILLQKDINSDNDYVKWRLAALEGNTGVFASPQAQTHINDLYTNKRVDPSFFADRVRPNAFQSIDDVVEFDTRVHVVNVLGDPFVQLGLNKLIAMDRNALWKKMTNDDIDGLQTNADDAFVFAIVRVDSADAHVFHRPKLISSDIYPFYTLMLMYFPKTFEDDFLDDLITAHDELQEAKENHEEARDQGDTTLIAQAAQELEHAKYDFDQKYAIYDRKVRIVFKHKDHWYEITSGHPAAPSPVRVSAPRLINVITGVPSALVVDTDEDTPVDHQMGHPDNALLLGSESDAYVWDMYMREVKTAAQNTVNMLMALQQMYAEESVRDALAEKATMCSRCVRAFVKSHNNFMRQHRRRMGLLRAKKPREFDKLRQYVNETVERLIKVVQQVYANMTDDDVYEAADNEIRVHVRKFGQCLDMLQDVINRYSAIQIEKPMSNALRDIFMDPSAMCIHSIKILKMMMVWILIVFVQDRVTEEIKTTLTMSDTLFTSQLCMLVLCLMCDTVIVSLLFATQYCLRNDDIFDYFFFKMYVADAALGWGVGAACTLVLAHMYDKYYQNAGGAEGYKSDLLSALKVNAWRCAFTCVMMPYFRIG